MDNLKDGDGHAEVRRPRTGSRKRRARREHDAGGTEDNPEVRRRGWMLLGGLAAVGVALVLGGLEVQHLYWSALMMQFGSTLVLVAPLFFIERRLNARVTAISEELAGIRFSADVPVTTRAELAPLLRAYQSYMRHWGYIVDERPVRIRPIAPTTDRGLFGVLGTYDATTNTVLVDPQHVADPGVILREYSHHLLNVNTISPLSVDRGPWGARIGSSLAFYFPAASASDAMLFNDTMGSLANRVGSSELSPVGQDFVRAGWNWARLFWSMRAQMRASDLDLALAFAWAQGVPFDEGEHPIPFLREVITALRKNARMESIQVVREAMEDHGVPW